MVLVLGCVIVLRRLCGEETAMTFRAAGINEEIVYAVKSPCPKCGRNHVTVFKLRHVSDELRVRLASLKLGDLFRYAVHNGKDGEFCLNSAQHPDWGPR